MSASGHASRSADDRIGVVGLGIIGSVWATHYAAAGKLVATWNRSRKPGVPFAVDGAREVAARARVLHVVVSDPAAVESVLDAAAPELGAEHLVVQSTTIDPTSSERFAARVKARGAAYVEAPFMGSRPAAEQKKVVFMLGGEASAVERADAILAELSGSRFTVGTEPQASTLKLAFNLQVAITMQGIAESFALARRAGLPEEAYFRVLERTALWSGFLANKEPKLKSGDFSPQFSIKHMLKDVRLVSALASGPSAPLGAAVLEQLRRADEKGLTDLDVSALLEAL